MFELYIKYVIIFCSMLYAAENDVSVTIYE